MTTTDTTAPVTFTITHDNPGMYGYHGLVADLHSAPELADHNSRYYPKVIHVVYSYGAMTRVTVQGHAVSHKGSSFPFLRTLLAEQLTGEATQWIRDAVHALTVVHNRHRRDQLIAVLAIDTANPAAAADRLIGDGHITGFLSAQFPA